MSNARDKANIPALNFSSTGIDDNATSTAITIDSNRNIGIGETSPTSHIHLKSGGNTTVRFQGNVGGSLSTLLLSHPSTADAGLQFNSNQLHMFSYGDIAFFPDQANISGSYPNNEKMRIRHTGNVGIGTSSPSTKLQVTTGSSGVTPHASADELFIENSSGNSAGLTIASGTSDSGRLAFADTGSSLIGLLAYDHSNNSMQFTTNSSERMRIDSSGNVGIGTTSPNASDFGSQTGVVHLKDIGNNNTGIKLEHSTGKSMFMQNATNTFFGTISAHPLRFNTNTSERMRIDSSGDVGIGTSNPTGKLNIATSSTDGVNTLFGANTSPTAAGMYVGFNDSDATATLGVYYASNPYPILNVTRSDRTIKFMQGSTERMKIDTSGHVLPGSNDAQDLGSSSLVWRNIYTGDLHLSNEAKDEGNAVDGTKGNWTIQEGAEDLYILNNKTGKKFKFKLEEIS
jgi:hypothetical protein